MEASAVHTVQQKPGSVLRPTPANKQTQEHIPPPLSTSDVDTADASCVSRKKGQRAREKGQGTRSPLGCWREASPRRRVERKTQKERSWEPRKMEPSTAWSPVLVLRRYARSAVRREKTRARGGNRCQDCLVAGLGPYRCVIGCLRRRDKRTRGNPGLPGRGSGARELQLQPWKWHYDAQRRRAQGRN